MVASLRRCPASPFGTRLSGRRYWAILWVKTYFLWYYPFVAMGNVSFCNHAKDANWHFDIDEDYGVIRLVALEPLIDGTEHFIDYGD